MTEDQKTIPPWTAEEIANLNAFQNGVNFHPFTCGNADCREVLVAKPDGWYCPKCAYRQNWAHGFMAEQRREKCLGGCGVDFAEFPEMRHEFGDCPGPDCTCYEIIGGHQPGCPYGHFLRTKTAVVIPDIATHIIPSWCCETFGVGFDGPRFEIAAVNEWPPAELKFMESTCLQLSPT